ncbi:DUF192 domain-containing protein [Maribacter sp. 2307ULW6-5]|uniref:DUF192 domain-containing protein n=1 Tax=Maribacter sp. 2307ULW6-5 TaxID=3386275 RepID=UPI0039BD2A4C
MHISKRSGGLFLCCCIFLIGMGCKEGGTTKIKTEPVTFTKEGTLTIKKAVTDSIVAQLDIEIAETDYETQTGLMYREGMEDTQAMLFIFPDMAMHSFYMKNTQFPLDLIFIDDQLNIASFQENAQPYSEDGLSSQVPIQYVLEVNAGLAEKWTLDVGDRIAFSRNE